MRRGHQQRSVVVLCPRASDGRRPSVTVVALLLSAAVAALPHKPGRYIAIRTETGFSLFDKNGDDVVEIHRVGKLTPTSLAISPEGSLIAFTARPMEGTQQELYLAELSGANLRVVANGSGHYASPRFSASGDSLFFAFQPRGPMTRSGESNAQIVRLDLRTGQLKRLTISVGCKGDPDDSSGELTFNHSTCTGYQSIGGLDKSGNELTLQGGTTTSLWNARRSPNGKFVAFLERRRGSTYLKLVAPNRTTELEEWPGQIETVGLEWSADSKWLFFLKNNKVAGVQVEGRRK